MDGADTGTGGDDDDDDADDVGDVGVDIDVKGEDRGEDGMEEEGGGERLGLADTGVFFFSRIRSRFLFFIRLLLLLVILLLLLLMMQSSECSVREEEEEGTDRPGLRLGTVFDITPVLSDVLACFLVLLV